MLQRKHATRFSWALRKKSPCPNSDRKTSNDQSHTFPTKEGILCGFLLELPFLIE